MAYKYPYIADKNLYFAVVGACKMIREIGKFNKAVSYYADKYDVDEEDLEREIRKRQSAGQKGRTSPTKGKHFSWYIVLEDLSTDASGTCICNKVEIVKATSPLNAENRFLDIDFRKTMADDYGGSYSIHHSHFALPAGFKTEQAAKEFLARHPFKEFKKYDSDIIKTKEYFKKIALAEGMKIEDE